MESNNIESEKINFESKPEPQSSYDDDDDDDDNDDDDFKESLNIGTNIKLNVDEILDNNDNDKIEEIDLNITPIKEKNDVIDLNVEELEL